MSIHPTAIISPEADIADEVTIGPYVVVRGKVRIGKGTIIDEHATIGSEFGSVEMGKNNHVLASAVVGGPPQDLSYKNENTTLQIGNGNTIREFVTINTGTVKGGGVTKIGNDNLLMTYVHIAHDCILGSGIVIANSTHFAGHVIVEDKVVIGGGCLLAQFITLGKHCYIAGDTSVNKDVLPFTIAQGKYATIRATNKIGIERAGMEKSEVENIHKAVRCIIKGDRTIAEAIEKIESECTPSENITYLKEFATNSSRGIAR